MRRGAMKKISLAVVLLVLVFSLVSCATGPKFSTMQIDMASKDPEMGRIFFYRVTALGAALRPDVLLNKEKVGEAVAQGFFYVDRAPGDYEVVTSTEVERKVTFVLEKGQTRYIRFNVSFGFFVGHVYGELVDESLAREELKDCSCTMGQTLAE
jgi:opacity protein-like surface antigen